MSVNVNGETAHGKFTEDELAQVRALVAAREEFKRQAKEAGARIQIIELNALLRDLAQQKRA